MNKVNEAQPSAIPSSEDATHLELSADPAVVIGSWQCPDCEALAMTTWRGQPKDEDAPTCCDGYPMLPYNIPSQEERDVKTVSRWIADIER